MCLFSRVAFHELHMQNWVNVILIENVGGKNCCKNHFENDSNRQFSASVL